MKFRNRSLIQFEYLYSLNKKLKKSKGSKLSSVVLLAKLVLLGFRGLYGQAQEVQLVVEKASK